MLRTVVYALPTLKMIKRGVSTPQFFLIFIPIAMVAIANSGLSFSFLIGGVYIFSVIKGSKQGNSFFLEHSCHNRISGSLVVVDGRLSFYDCFCYCCCF